MKTIPAPRPTRRMLKLATEWHSGQSSMLYAVASTGDLTLGNRGPYGVDGPMDDAGWHLSLWVKMSREIGETVGWLDSTSPNEESRRDYDALVDFLVFANRVVAMLREAYGSE